MKSNAQKVELLCNWLQEKVRNAKAAGLVVGLSGGIDSSLVATLAVKALGRENVYGVIMPCLSSPADKEDAETLAGWLAIRQETVDLEPVFTRFLQCLGEDGEQAGANPLNRGNLKARLRMSTLYYRAGQLGYLVAGTGNKSEIMLGYYTKYGDGGVDLEPLGGLYKSGVQELARFLGVPKTIIDKAPSAGLWADQTDEQELGMSYDAAEQILRYLEENGMDAAAAPQFREEDFQRVKSLWKGSAHKREMPPVCGL